MRRRRPASVLIVAVSLGAATPARAWFESDAAGGARGGPR